VKLNLEVVRDRSQFLVFELSRFLKIQTVEQDGHAVEFIQNPAVEGTRLARSGNDLVAVILSEPARKGQKIDCASFTPEKCWPKLAKACSTWGRAALGIPTADWRCPISILLFIILRNGCWLRRVNRRQYRRQWLRGARSTQQISTQNISTRNISMPNVEGDQVGRWVFGTAPAGCRIRSGQYVRATGWREMSTLIPMLRSGSNETFPIRRRRLNPYPTHRGIKFQCL